MFLIDPAKRRRWIGVGLLAVGVSIIEATAMALVLFLLTRITAPQSTTVPVVGDISGWLPGWDADTVLVVTAIFIGVFFLIRGAANLLQLYAQNRVAFTAGADLSTRLLRGYLAMPYVVHVQRSSPELIRNAHESTLAFSQQILFPATTMVSEGLMCVTIFLFLLIAAPLTTGIAVVALVPPILILLKFTQPRLHRLGLLGQEMSAGSLKSVQQTLHSLRDIRVLHREHYFETEFRHTRNALSRAYYLRAVLVDTPRLVLETALILFVALFIVLSTVLNQSSGQTLSSLGLFGYAALRLLPSLNRIMNNVQSFRFGRPYITVLHEEALRADRDVAAAPSESGADISFKHEIRLHDVSFTYGGAAAPALSDINLRIGRGEWIGIVGTTGGGKSTLVDVLLCLLEPSSGVVTIDGVDVQNCVVGWQHHLGVVSQHMTLLDDTIRKNIAFGLPDEGIDAERIDSAVRMAQLTDFIESLPGGLETSVGERGVKLSGGQRQRVAIARALYRDPDVVVFDEGTSALDNRTESKVIEAIEQLRGERTLITVAHRLTTVQKCDRVVLLDRGRIADVGRFDELMSRHGEFQTTGQ